MGISSIFEYVDFYLNLNMGRSVTLLSFANNEKLILKQKLEYKNLKKGPIQNGITILEELIKEVQEIGEEKVLEKYKRQLD